MASEDDLNGEMPEPEAIWLALGLVTWAMAVALAPTPRARFINALERLASEHATRGRVITFSPPSLRTGSFPRATRIAITWVRRILDELRAARG